MHHSKGGFLGSAVSMMTVGVIPLCSAAAGALGELGMSAVPTEMKQVWPKAPQPLALGRRGRQCACAGRVGLFDVLPQGKLTGDICRLGVTGFDLRFGGSLQRLRGGIMSRKLPLYILSADRT